MRCLGQQLALGINSSLKERSRLIKALDNRFYVKFMQLEIGLFIITHVFYKCNIKTNI